jgi:hypothetical protein
VKPGTERPTVPVQLRGGLWSPNRTVTPTGTITIHMAESSITKSQSSSYTHDTKHRGRQILASILWCRVLWYLILASIKLGVFLCTLINLVFSKNCVVIWWVLGCFRRDITTKKDAQVKTSHVIGRWQTFIYLLNLHKNDAFTSGTFGNNTAVN